MADVIPFPPSAPSEARHGSLEVWQSADGTWTIDHVSRWGDSAGVVKAGIDSQQKAIEAARDLARRHGYRFDGLTYTGSRP